MNGENIELPIIIRTKNGHRKVELCPSCKEDNSLKVSLGFPSGDMELLCTECKTIPTQIDDVGIMPVYQAGVMAEDVREKMEARDKAYRQSTIRMRYQSEVTQVALHILNAKMLQRSMMTMRATEYAKLPSNSDMIDEALILAKMFVDEVSKQTPSKSFEEKAAAIFDGSMMNHPMSLDR